MLKRVTIGPVDSKHPAFDKDLKDYLRDQGFSPNATEQEWSKECSNAIAAELQIEAAYAHIGRLVGKHAPQLPNAFMF